MSLDAIAIVVVSAVVAVACVELASSAVELIWSAVARRRRGRP